MSIDIKNQRQLSRELDAIASLVSGTENINAIHACRPSHPLGVGRPLVDNIYNAFMTINVNKGNGGEAAARLGALWTLADTIEAQ